MNTVERVKKICKARKIAISKLEVECGFGNGYIGKLQKGTFPQDRLIIISEYLGLPMDYLLGVKDDYGLIPDQWDQIGRLFSQFSFDNGKSIVTTADDTGISQEKIADFFNIGIPLSGLELHQICMAWNIPMDKVIGAYADAFANKKSPAVTGKATTDQIKAAFWGGEKDLDPEEIDELWEDAWSYIQFKTQQKKKEKRK